MNQHTAPEGLSQSLGMVRVVEHGEAGKAVIEYRASLAMCHSGGIVQGGFVTGWIDAAMAYAVIAATKREFSPLSLEIKISFLKAASPGLVIAEAWIEKLGRSNLLPRRPPPQRSRGRARQRNIDGEAGADQSGLISLLSSARFRASDGAAPTRPA